MLNYIVDNVIMNIGIGTVAGFVLLLVIGLSVISAFWLILRPIRLWYWKRSEEVKLLKSIDEKLLQKTDKASQINSEKQMCENIDSDNEECEHREKQDEVKIDEYVGIASDRSYTEEELYEIIKF
ncbi:MAG: hypothetical protein ACTTH0_05005 [Eubacteriales bacterium]